MLREFKQWIREQFIGRFGPIYTPELIIGGMQKSGTTAIAALIAKATKKNVTLDLEGEYKNTPILDRPIRCNWPITRILRHYREDLKKEIVKEPSLSVLFPLLLEAMPKTSFIMIVRDPRDCIRSILNRHDLPGNLDNLSKEQYDSMNKAWRLVFDGSWLNLNGKNYIETLAKRWQYIMDISLANKSRIVIVKYEDFIKDKLTFIQKLADDLGLIIVNDISYVLDAQYQPKGNRNVKWGDFFGENNLDYIQTNCQKGMFKMGYKKLPIQSHP